MQSPLISLNVPIAKSSYNGRMIDDDPVLGPYIDHHPSDRLRLLIVGGAVLGVVWFVVTVALWQAEVGLADAKNGVSTNALVLCRDTL